MVDLMPWVGVSLVLAAHERGRAVRAVHAAGEFGLRGLDRDPSLARGPVPFLDGGRCIVESENPSPVRGVAGRDKPIPPASRLSARCELVHHLVLLEVPFEDRALAVADGRDAAVRTDRDCPQRVLASGNAIRGEAFPAGQVPDVQFLACDHQGLAAVARVDHLRDAIPHSPRAQALDGSCGQRVSELIQALRAKEDGSGGGTDRD